MFKQTDKLTDIQIYDEALHQLIADLHKMEDRVLRGIGNKEKTLLLVDQQLRLVEHAQLAYDQMLPKQRADK